MIYPESFNKLITILLVSATICISSLSGNICKRTEPASFNSVKFVYEETIHGKTQKYKRLIQKSDRFPYKTTVSIRDYTGRKVIIEGKNLSVTEKRKEPENIEKIHITCNDQGLIEISLIGGSNSMPSEFLYVSGRKATVRLIPSLNLKRHGKHHKRSSNSKFLEQAEIRRYIIGDSAYQTKVVIKREEFFSQCQTCPTIEIYGRDLHTQEENDQLPPATVVAEINKDSGMLEVNVLGNHDEQILTITDYDPTDLPKQLPDLAATNIFKSLGIQFVHRVAHFLSGF